jgi:hypothetical protein
LLAVAGAAANLAAHHGTTPLHNMAPGKFWDCHGKDCKGNPCGYKVPVGRIACDACGHQPPLHVSCPGKRGDKAKGASATVTDEKRSGREGSNTAEAKLKAALKAKAASEAKSNDNAKALVADKAELKKLKEAAAVAPCPAAALAMELDHDGPETGTSALEAAISAARDELKQTQAFTDFQKSLVPDFAAALAAARAKVEAALVARRAASPLKKQLEGAEGHQQRSSKKVADAKALLETRREEASKAQAAVQLQEEALADVLAVLAKADAQVAELAARFASERNAAPAALATDGAPLQAESFAAPPEGYVTIALAEARWHEREQEFQKIIAEARALAGSDPANSLAPSEAAASDVADIASLDASESVDDDDKWSKVGKDKRKALLSKQRDVLASKVSRSLAKVSLTESPFSKKAKVAPRGAA